MSRLENVLANIISGYITFCFSILIITVIVIFIEWLGK